MIRPVRSDGRIDTGGPFKPIPRPRIVERIAEAAAFRVSLIIAPAGYGKSVALTQFLEKLDEPWSRFDLRPEHDTLPGVLRGMSEALEPVAPELRPTLAVAYERNRASATPGADLAIWMHEHLKEYRGTIAIDDLHIADGDPEVLRFLVALIERTKKQIRWILSTRTSAGLPIGTWLAYNDCDLVVDDWELRFNEGEAREIAAAFKIAVRDDELRKLLSVTDGWPTGLTFALRSATRAEDFFSGPYTATREVLYNYLADQVYRSLSEEEREFLEAAALLAEIDVDAMVAIGFDRTRKLINDLRERVAFIHQVSPGIYRCHDLFRDFVLHQLEEKGESAINGLRCKIAASLEKIARVHTPLRLYIDAGAEEHVLRLLRQNGFEMVNTAHVDLVQNALSALTEEHLKNEPVVLALRGAIEAGKGRFDEAETLLRRGMSRTDDLALQATVAMQLAVMLINTGKDATALIDEVVAEAERIPQNLFAEALALRAVIAVRVQKDPVFADALLDRVDEVTKFSVEDESLARVKQRVGVTALELRQDQRARSALSQSVAICKRLSLHSLLCRAYDNLAIEARSCENDVPNALWYAQEAQIAAAKSGSMFDLQLSVLRLLAIQLWRGDEKEISELEMRAADLRTSDKSRVVHLLEARGYRAVWNDQIDEARRTLASYLKQVVGSVDEAHTTVTRALYAFCLAIGGDDEDARDEVNATLVEIDTAKPRYDSFGSLAYEVATLSCALAEAICGRHMSVKRILKRPSITSRIGAHAMRDAVTYLCRAAAHGARSPRDVARKIQKIEEHGLGGFAKVVHVARRYLERMVDEAPSTLTDTELRIIRMLAGGQSRSEIAEATGRSLLTVQTHIKHAIAKLGSAGIEQAIEQARGRGLIA
jgi:ATP/maltotriose-dependent transcriptional regulator MalT